MEDMHVAKRPSTTSGGAAGEIDKKPLATLAGNFPTETSSLMTASGTAAAFECAGVTLPSSIVICSDPEL
ncbi:MAG TPA: hypothetical protein VGI22_16055, partial [Xanthobacteraceae bacterium]